MKLLGSTTSCLELIAQRPRSWDESRLLVYDRSSGDVRHCVSPRLPAELTRASWWSRTTRASCPRGFRSSGRGARSSCSSDATRTALGSAARPTRGCVRAAGTALSSCSSTWEKGRWLLRLEGDPAGEAPLPPYITEPLADPTRYQTVYAEEANSAAAPTASLHFTPEAARAARHRVRDAPRGAGYVPAGRRRRPRRERNCSGTPSGLRRGTDRRRRPRAGRRHDDSSRAQVDRARGSARGRTSLFITPGFQFQRVDALLTNFHLLGPRCLRSSWPSPERTRSRELYRTAIAERYRFSFSDAMLVLWRHVCG